MEVKKTLFVFYFYLLLFPALVLAQNSDGPKEVTKTYFFEHVNIVQKPGVLLPFTKMIVRNGVIEDIGNQLKMPADAIPIKADSMYIYAGFMDAFSHVGIPKSENKDAAKIEDPGNPPNDVAGITPQINSTETYKPDDKSVSELRSLGFTIAHVAPRGYMLPGQTCLFSLKDGAIDDVLIKKNEAMTAQFSTNRSVYPSTVIGVMAKFKELYKNAQILTTNQTIYNTNPTGLQRPVLKKEEEALQRVTQGKQSIYFNTTTGHQISRAQQLQKELGFSIVLANVKNGSLFIPGMSTENTKFVLSLDLPEETKEKKKGKGDEKPMSDEEKQFEEKRKKSLKEYEEEAARFEAANIPFAFSTMDAKPGDIHKNIRRMIQAGLSEKAALTALTTTPANWYGLSKMTGTVEKGKWANLIIVDTTIFSEKANIKWVFVEGNLYENKQQDKKDKNSEESGDWQGKWTFSVDFQGEVHTGSLQIQGKNEISEIVVIIDDYPDQKDKATDIQQQNNQLKFSLDTQNENGKVTYEVDITLDNSRFTGSVTLPSVGTFPITGDKKPNQNN